MALPSLLGSFMTVETFFAEYWQKKAFHIPATDANRNHFDEYFPIEAVEEMWANAAIAEKDFLIFSETGVQSTLRVPFLAFAHRCSVVVNRSDLYSSHVLELCESLQVHFPFAFCNSYCTPPGSQTVRKHSDDREVLLLQIYGEKEWLLYNDPVRLPYRDEEVGKGNPVEEATLTEPQKYTVRQGDVLYMPRGVVHEGRSSPKCSSLHLTIALQSSDWDYATILVQGLQQLLRSVPMVGSRLCPPMDDLLGRQGSSAQSQEEAQRLLQGALTQPTYWSDAVTQFHNRLEGMRVERRRSVQETIRPIPLPVSMDTLVQWNPRVTVRNIQPAQPTPNMPHMTAVATLSLATPHGSHETQLGCTEELKRCVEMLSSKPTLPVPVGELPFFDTIGKASAAIAMINNQIFLRVS